MYSYIRKYKLGYYVADYVNLNTKMIIYINLVFIIVQPRTAIEPLVLKRALKATPNECRFLSKCFKILMLEGGLLSLYSLSLYVFYTCNVNYGDCSIRVYRSLV